jgi:ABC-type uncharacterized transport system fused permease/ATPase subunit
MSSLRDAFMQESPDSQKKQEPPLLHRLKTMTILSSWPAATRIPGAICDRMLRIVTDTEEVPENEGPGVSIFESAKNRFNRLRAGISLEDASSDIPIGQQLGTLRGALGAYWMEKKWEACSRTGAVLGFTALASANIVWIAQASGRLTDAFVGFINSGANPELLNPLAQQGLIVAGLGLLSASCYHAGSYIQGHLQRDMSGWIVNKFSNAVLREPGILYRLSHNKDPESKDPDVMPDAPQQRIMHAAWTMPEELFNLGKGAWSAVISSLFVAVALHNNSVPVDSLDHLAQTINSHLPEWFVDLSPGEKGTFVTAMISLAVFGVVNTPFARRFATRLEKIAEKHSKAGSEHYSRLWNIFEEADSIAVSKTHYRWQATLADAWKEKDRLWGEEIKEQRRFGRWLSFQNAAAGAVATLPGLAGVLSGKLSFGGFMQHSVLLGTLMRNLANLVNIIPATANLKMTAKRLAELALMVDKAGDRQSFYRLSGFHEFEYPDSDPEGDFALEIKNLRLLHRGQNAEQQAFVEIESLKVKKGDKVYIKGNSGCGKTSLMKTISGLWGYGEGKITRPHGQHCVYVAQFPDIPIDVSLAGQVKHGMPVSSGAKAGDDERIIEALKLCGLFKQLNLEGKSEAELREVLNARTNKGQHWASTLSGGQKQRLVLARLIYQQPDLILLDEPTSALDKNGHTAPGERHTDAQSLYFEALGECCPNSTVLAIMHDEAPIDPRIGFFNKILRFEPQSRSPVLCDLQSLSIQETYPVMAAEI